MMINSSGRAISVSRRTAEVYVSCKDAANALRQSAR